LGEAVECIGYKFVDPTKENIMDKIDETQSLRSVVILGEHTGGKINL